MCWHRRPHGQTRALLWPKKKRQRPGQRYGLSPGLRRLLRDPSTIPHKTRPVWWCLAPTQSQVREIKTTADCVYHQGHPVIPEVMSDAWLLEWRDSWEDIAATLGECVVDCERGHYQDTHSFSCCSLRKQIRRAAVVCVCVCWLLAGWLLSLASDPHSSGWSDWSRDLSHFSVSWVNLTKTCCISHRNQEKEIRHFWSIWSLFLWQLSTFLKKIL